jgi:probable HAF family extracellular repeat protein
MKFQFLPMLIGLLLVSHAGGALAQMTIVDLGTLPGGSFSTALDINDRGQVVGVSNNAEGANRAVLWDNGRIVDLGTLPGGTHSAAMFINNRGQIAGTSDSGDFFTHAVLWDGGRIIDLGTLPGFGFSQPTALNERGQVVGEAETAATGQSRAFVWDDAVHLDLGFGTSTANNDLGEVVGFHRGEVSSMALPFLWHEGVLSYLATLRDDAVTAPVAINASGQVAGTGPTPAGSRAIFWDGGVPTDLGALPGHFRSWAEDMNGSGAVVGASQSDTVVEAILWVNGRTVRLGTLGTAFSIAHDINDRGQIAGVSVTPTGGPHIVLWTDGRMLDLGVLPGARVLDFYQPPAINERGQVVSQGATATGEIHAVVWTPAATTTLRVDSPNEPSRWGIGTTHRVAWTYAGTAAQFAVEISRDDGAWELLAMVPDRPGPSQNADVAIAGPASATARVRVRAVGAVTETSDANDAAIRIEPAAIRIVLPTTTRIAYGSRQEVFIAHNLGAGAPIAVDLSGDDGRTWRTVSGDLRTMGTTTSWFAGVVDLPPTMQGRMRVRAMDGSGALAISPPFAVTAASPGTR